MISENSLRIKYLFLGIVSAWYKGHFGYGGSEAVFADFDLKNEYLESESLYRTSSSVPGLDSAVGT